MIRKWYGPRPKRAAPPLGGNMTGPYHQFFLFDQEVKYEVAFDHRREHAQGKLFFPEGCMAPILEALEAVPCLVPSKFQADQEIDLKTWYAGLDDPTVFQRYSPIQGLHQYGRTLLIQEGAPQAQATFTNLAIQYTQGDPQLYMDGTSDEWVDRSKYVSALQQLASWAELTAQQTHYIFHFGI